MTPDLSGKFAIVTGATSGIGLVTAEYLASEPTALPPHARPPMCSGARAAAASAAHCAPPVPSPTQPPTPPATHGPRRMRR